MADIGGYLGDVLSSAPTRYLAWLGLDPAPPSAEALAELHRTQVERVPYSTIDIHLHRPCPLDPAVAIDRIVRTGRAGYCYNLNGALATLLTELGYQVRRHRATVWSDPAELATVTYPNHLALTVHGLPAPDNPDGAWLIDAGLGDALHEPLPLIEGEYPQGPFRYRLECRTESAGWRFHHDPHGSFRAFDLADEVAGPTDFDAGHVDLSTSPDSSFVRHVIVQRRDATGADKLINQTVRRTEGARTVEWEVRTPAEWFAAIADVFGLPLDDLDEADRDQLWRDAQTGQEAWHRVAG